MTLRKAAPWLIVPAIAAALAIITPTYATEPSLTPAEGFAAYGVGHDRSFHTEIELFETLLSHGANEIPANVFALVNAYVAANQQGIGHKFFADLDTTYGDAMSAAARAHILAAQGILRALHADDVFLLARIGWVRDTFAILERAAALSPNDPWVQWSAGLVYAQVPGFFGKRDDAIDVLTVLAAAPEDEPLPGMYREVYRHLARLHAREGNNDVAAEFARRSGMSDLDDATLNIGWFVTDPQNGTRMAPEPTVHEVVPGRVFSLYGFGFSDLHFVLSADGRQLIAIDAGTQPFATTAALAMLRDTYPELPPVGTLIATHGHWDHVAGTPALLAENPDLRIIGNAQFHDVRTRSQRGHIFTNFRSTRFDSAWLNAYAPTRLITADTTVTIGGTTINLIPVTGGETEDAMLIHLPDLDTVFVGDILMPFYGEPWTGEGDVPAALNTMDRVIALQADHIIHGHRPLTLIYGPGQIDVYRDALAWLITQTQAHLAKGYSRKDIQRLNLIPPGLEQAPQAWLGYLGAREHAIARLADAHNGIWQEEQTGQSPEGIFNITVTERANLLSRYFGLTRSEVEGALVDMLAAGDNELALQTAVAAEHAYDSPRIHALKVRAAANLRAANQYLDPFKFTVFSQMADSDVAPRGAPQ